MNGNDIRQLVDLYTEAVKGGKITSDQAELLKLAEGVNS